MTDLKTVNDYAADKPHILVIDDDRRIRDLVSRYLHENGFIVLSAEDAADAEQVMQRFLFDVLVVDVMMPGITGVEFVKTLRDKGQTVPVLLLTALAEIDDRIDGLEAGADDYLTKPFEPKELVLRLQAILRRTRKAVSGRTAFMIGQWRFDMDHDELQSDEGGAVRLTSVEGNLLRALLESVGEAVSREDLALRCGLDTGERTIDVQVTRLRRKIEEDTKAPRYLQTVRGRGYLLRAEQSS